ncbi:hypothetical protein ABPG74_003200 [Tetrahymena malaccensis]
MSGKIDTRAGEQLKKSILDNKSDKLNHFDETDQRLNKQNLLIQSMSNELLEQSQDHQNFTPFNKLDEVFSKSNQFMSCGLFEADQNQRVLINLQDIDTMRQEQFNKQEVSTQNSIDEANSMIIRALQKKPKERRSSNLNELLKIMENLPFFQKYIEDGQRDILLKCCQQMQIEFFEKDQNVFEIGTIGEKFYLILEGEVEVYAKIPNSQITLSSIVQIGSQTTKNQNQLLQEKDLSEQMSQINNNSNKAGNIEYSQVPRQLQAFSYNKISQQEITETRISSKLEQYDSSPTKKQYKQDSQKQKSSNNSLKAQQDILQSQQIKKTDIYHKSPESNKELNQLPQTPAQSLINIIPNDYSQLMLVKKLKEGQSFGELALIYNKPRLATIKCVKKCTFAVLEKNQYLEILKTAEQRNILKQIDKLSEIPLFKQLSFEFLKEIYLNSEQIQFRKNDVVFSKGDPSNAVYIVQQGEFSIRNRYNCPQQGFENDALLKKLESMSKEGIDSLLRSYSSSKQKAFTLLNMCANEMFGEEDLLKDQNRSFDVYCSSFTGQLLVIKDIDFKLRVFERNDYIHEYILTRSKNKEMILQEKEKNLIEQFSKYKNYLVENRDELKNIIFSQILMDQTFSMPQSPQSKQDVLSQTTRSPYNQSGLSPLNNQGLSPNRFKQLRQSDVFQRNKKNSQHKFQSQFQQSEFSINQESPRSCRINEFEHNNSFGMQSYQDTKNNQTDQLYYYVNSPKKQQFRQNNAQIIYNNNQGQRSYSDSSRYYTKTSYQPKTTFEYLDLEESTNLIPNENQDRKITSNIDPNEIKQQANQSPNSPNNSRTFQNGSRLEDPQEKTFTNGRKSPRQNIYNEEFFEKESPLNEKLPESEDKKNQLDNSQQNKQNQTATQTGFFQIEVSKRKRIMLASKYDYQNYLQDKDSQNRYLIPVKKILTKTLKDKRPLLIDLVQQNGQQITQNQQTKVENDQTKQSINQDTKKIRKSNLKNSKNLSISTNVDEKLLDFSTNSNKSNSFYLYQVKNENQNIPQSYDIQINPTENALLTSRMKRYSPLHYLRQTCKSADSQRIMVEKNISNLEKIDSQQQPKQNIYQSLIQKKEQNNSTKQNSNNQMIKLQINPYVDEVYLQDDLNSQIQSTKKPNSILFNEQESYKNQMSSVSPIQNLSPKKVIETYKHFLANKQQAVQKSNKLGAFTAYNKTRDTTFYIQKNVEKKMIQTMADWRKSSQIPNKADFLPYNIQSISSTVPIKLRNPQTPKTYRFSYSTQSDLQTQTSQEKKLPSFPLNSRNSLSKN